MTDKGFDAVVLGSGGMSNPHTRHYTPYPRRVFFRILVGLSTAIELRNRGLRVAVVAKDLPEDSESSGWASPWAGCNWYPFEADPNHPASLRERDTFHYLVQLAKSRPDLCERIPFQNVWNKPKSEAESELWFSELVKDYRPIQGPIPGNHAHGREWSAFVMHAPKYMLYLAERARALGIPLIRKRLSSLDQAYDLPETGKVDVVVNASGLGAQTLIGVEDAKVYPGRGQTVLVETPRDVERVCVMSAEDFYAANDDTTAGPAYIIPRPGPDPHVICGGVYIPHAYSSLPCLRTAERILQDCYALRPELAGHKTAGEGNGWRDIKVISHNVGLRPAREGGARVEVQRRKMGERAEGKLGHKGIRGEEGEGEGQGREVVVVHAYGFGSAGYQQSIGAAYQVAKLIEDEKLVPRQSARL